MIVREVYVGKSEGPLVPKELSAIASVANKFMCEVSLETPTIKANAKSLMGLISLGIKNKQKFMLVCKGNDEEEAIEELIKFFSSLK